MDGGSLAEVIELMRRTGRDDTRGLVHGSTQGDGEEPLGPDHGIFPGMERGTKAPVQVGAAGGSSGPDLVHDYLEGRPPAVALVNRWIREEIHAGFPVLRHDADDLCQVVHGKLFEALRRGSFRHESSLRTYVSRMARYSAVDELRRLYRDPLWNPRAESAIDLLKPNPYRIPASLEQGTLLRQILLHSASECRRLWHLAFVEQLSYGEIARALGIAAGTVKSRMSRCRERVMQLLGSADD